MSVRTSTRAVSRLPKANNITKATRRESISPPPSKRRRIEHPTELAPTLPLRPLQPLDSSSLRVFTWNVNGIKPFLQPSILTFFKYDQKRSRTPSPQAGRSVSDPKSHNLRECLRRWQWPHVVCLQEVKIAHGDLSTQRAVQHAVKQQWQSDVPGPGYKAFFSLPTDKHNARGFGGKLYGVCTLVRNDVFEDNKDGQDEVSIRLVDWEREGRVLVMRLPKRKLLIINVYAVNGTDYAWRNSSGAEIGTRHDYKKLFHSQLHDMIRSYEVFGWFVVVAGDLNIARGLSDGFPGIRLSEAHVTNRQDFDKKFMRFRHDNHDAELKAGQDTKSHGDQNDEPVEGLGMVDSFRELHGMERKYTYRSPNVEWGSSCDRVDLILLTRGLEREPAALIEADILDDESERGPSDHLPSFVTLDLSKIDERHASGRTHIDDTLDPGMPSGDYFPKLVS